jgi:hypothetical protein
VSSSSSAALTSSEVSSRGFLLPGARALASAGKDVRVRKGAVQVERRGAAGLKGRRYMLVFNGKLGLVKPGRIGEVTGLDTDAPRITLGEEGGTQVVLEGRKFQTRNRYMPMGVNDKAAELACSVRD